MGQPSMMSTGGYQNGTQQYYQPYYDQMAQQTNATAQTPFTPYSGEIAPGANQYQTNAAQGLQNFAMPSQFGQGTGMLQNAYNQMGGQTGYQAGNIASTYNPQAVSMFSQPAGSSMYQAPQASQMFNQPGQVASTYAPGQFDPAAASQYMNPYTQNVTAIQQRDANRQFAQQQAARDTNAAQVGAFGGGRSALVNQAAQRDQNTLLSDITQKGQDAAFQNAQAQYERDRQAQATAAQMKLGAGEFNAQQGMQYGLAGLQNSQFNNTMQQQVGRDSLQNQQFNAGQGMQYGQLGLQNAQYNEGQRQNAASMSLQGQIANQAAQAQAQALRDQAISSMGQMGASVGQLGAQQGQLGLGALSAQGQLGNQMWQNQMAGDQANYNDYMTQQQWPMQQLSWENSIMKGLPGPTLQNRSTYGVGPNPYAGGLNALNTMGGILGNTYG